MPLVELPDSSYQLNTRCMRHPQIQYDEIELGKVGAHMREQLRHALDDHGAVSGRIECGQEAITHEWRVSGDQNSLARSR
jgi:hypothetical protein